MIVDLEKRGDRRMFVTGQVSSIKKNRNGLLTVRFTSSPRIFNYNPSRLLYLTDPTSVELEGKGVYIKNRHITDVEELLRFSDGRHVFYHAVYTNGFYDDFEGGDVYVTRTPIDKNGGTTWDYLRKLAAETGLMTENDDNILSKQYDLVDVKRDNVPLARYIGGTTKTSTYRMPGHIYYPFGCNASQKAAVEAALTHQVSIIQGPPGTGKTQTILNIIANLLMADKTVLVVSNNNSAVENVAEKLDGENLGFMVAQLGSVQNKENFIVNQSGYPDMKEWHLEEAARIERLVSGALETVTQNFDNQTRLALLRGEYDDLTKETKYNGMLHQSPAGNEWLDGINSSILMRLLNRYQIHAENGRKPGLWFRIKWSFAAGMKMFPFLNGQPSRITACLETAYYYSRKREIEHEMNCMEEAMRATDINQKVKELRTYSLQILKANIAGRYDNRKRQEFTVKDIKPRTEEFLQEYPVVLSTAYSAKNCISKDMVFDYVIMDEASQVDIKTGALALSCANNAVIVGDDKQLPNVVSRDEALALNAIQSAYKVDDRYNAVTHSFLQSCTEVFKNSPVTLLREHYRCHPKIIGFCNQRFYDRELVAMTTDQNEENVLRVVRTVPGNHARGHFNQREIDTILQEVIPEYAGCGSIGIITPYRLQAKAINEALGKEIASTVHKYQGRECDTIIMSMVDNTPTEFSDDANLLNVAVSRAKTRLCIVTNGNEIPQDSNIGQLVKYIQYNNFEVRESKLHSVFDILYKQYTAERLAYEKAHKPVSSFLSENLIYYLLTNAIEKLKLGNTGVLCHYPLSRLITDLDCLNTEERRFAESPYSHIDFMVYNSLTKSPMLAIEVDGWHYHKQNAVQQSRDALKGRILSKLGLCLHRISTTDTVNGETITELVAQRFGVAHRTE